MATGLMPDSETLAIMLKTSTEEIISLSRIKKLLNPWLTQETRLMILLLILKN